MLKHLKTFFSPTALTYSYNKPKELVIAEITEILKKKVTFLGSTDMTGKFLNQNTFAINIASLTSGIKYSSTLVGKIIESENGMTEVSTTAKPAFSLYSTFFMALVLGLIYLYKFFQTGSAGILFGSLAMLFLGPALSIAISNVEIYSVRERYTMYIDKALIA